LRCNKLEIAFTVKEKVSALNGGAIATHKVLEDTMIGTPRQMDVERIFP
jgi:hypothetical protein